MTISPDGKKITIRLPDNWHFHFRQKQLMTFLVMICLRYGWRARIVGQPNVSPSNTTADLAMSYKDEIMAVAKGQPYSEKFEVVPALQITERTTKAMIYEFKQRGGKVTKVYPLNVTTNSDNGVFNYLNIYSALAACEEVEIIVQFHAQHPSYEIEGWYKEIKFIELIAEDIKKQFPGLKFTIEHIQGAYGVQWVKAQSSRIAAGVTIQHITNTIDDLIGYSEQSHGKICVHNGYKPHAGLRADRQAIQEAILEGDPHFFYAGDDAWHFKKAKECAEGACGAANTLATLAKLASFFIKYEKLHLLEPFTSEIGARFYGYPILEETLTLINDEWIIPQELKVPGTDDTVIPWGALDREQWQVAA